MLSYQHAFHAGNAADLHKHAVLAGLIELLTVKARGITVMESHAGRGLYDLGGAEAIRTGEARAGVLTHPPTGGPYADVLARTRAAHGAQAYPGSPMIARQMLRPQDRLVLCELHPGEHAQLRRTLGGPGVAIHRRDGHEALPALSPPRPRRGLALIDPSYELKDEYRRAGDTALATLRRWPEAVILVWYPVLSAGRHLELVERLVRSGAGAVRSEVDFRQRPDRGMTGSGLVCLNLPHGGRQAIEQAVGTVAAAFARADGGARGTRPAG